MKMKISDASWANDEEPPPQFLEFSDDEEEQKAKREIKMRKKIQSEAQAGSSEGTESKRPRHGNQRYSPAVNPFYRTSRSYQPGQLGPGPGVQWGDYRLPSQYQQPPPPPPPSSSHYPAYYPGHSPAGQPVWPPQYSHHSQHSPYHQLAANINYHQQQQQQIFPNLNLPPPPPPPPGTD